MKLVKLLRLKVYSLCAATSGRTHSHLVLLGNKVVYHDHLEPQLTAQLTDVLQKALSLSVMLLL